MVREGLEVTAADGRRLCAELTGPADGALVFFHMGTPGSNEIWDKHIEEGARRGLRHVCCARPGVEGSERQPGRSIASAAADVSAVVDALEVNEFYVVGHSIGGNHALACAALLGERVISAAVINSFAPRQARGFDWKAGMGEWNDAEFDAIEAGDEALESYIEACFDVYRGIRDRAALLEAFGDSLSAPDRETLAGGFLDFQLTGCARVADHGIWGWFDDDRAVWAPWGFEPAGITVPVSVWHGAEDRIAPVSHGEWLAANIPGARLHLLPDEGHLSLWARHYGAVLDELLSA